MVTSPWLECQASPQQLLSECLLSLEPAQVSAGQAGCIAIAGAALTWLGTGPHVGLGLLMPQGTGCTPTCTPSCGCLAGSCPNPGEDEVQVPMGLCY